MLNINYCMNQNDSIPWVEKYRPTNLESVVLDDINRTLLNNILEFNYFPNLLLYGPPGTGKTTTMINLVKQYQKNNNEENKGLMIHLNASDERGIDTIRSQICSFVSSKGLFSDGMKFVILDEVDYMTKNAQLALRCLLNSTCSDNVRFCLICNYISRIDESLQNDFIRLRFNQLPSDMVLAFLNNIINREKLEFSDTILRAIQTNFGSDIRSMINFIQTNQNNNKNCKVITNVELERIHKMFYISESNNNTLLSEFYSICDEFQISERAIVKLFLNYIIRSHTKILNECSLNIIAKLMHDKDCNSEIYLRYFVSSWLSFTNNESDL